LFEPELLELCWVGATVEDRPRKTRIEALRDLPAKVRFLSMEPLLEDVGPLNLRGIDWVIIGGESGGGARTFDIEAARRIIEQCRVQDVAFFVKQMGCAPDGWWTNELGPRFNRHALTLDRRHGGDMDEWPHDLRVRLFPGEHV
jgi:protein gp37